MSQFHTQSFATRFQKMGDEAEGVFTKVHPTNTVKFGLDRPPIGLKNVPTRIRYTPDFLTAQGLVEVKGVGRDQLLKLKVENWNCLLFWNGVFATSLFVWDSHNRRYAYVDLADIERIMNDPDGGIVLKTFPERKAYFEIPLHSIEAWFNEARTAEELGLAA